MKLVVSLIPLLLAGCYTVDQAAFETHINERIKPGMPSAAAVAGLRNEGFNCDIQINFATVCTRTRHPWFTSICMERVSVLHDVFSGSREVRSVEVEKVECSASS